ncbi:MAG: hypothetical protein JKY37_32730 [Nannocystaceae bacterium]|nr:hypothetical protein [Nannocystaceae bacterium]
MVVETHMHRSSPPSWSPRCKLQTRSLTGFTRPILRITRKLRDDWLLEEDAGELLYAVYQDPESPSRASGFKIPQSALGAVVAAAAEDGGDGE